jgi:DNA-binding NtrC family response regulator
MENIKLLVVDDEEGVCDFVKSFFEDQGLKVSTALSGKEALEVFAKERPQIIILDILMKGMDGIEVLSKIKQIDKSNDVFMVTRVTDDPAMVKQSEKLGAAGYITKPLTLENLAKVVMEKVEKIKQQVKRKK